MVYIQEAHASDGWHVPINERDGVVFAQPTSMDERVEVAQACTLGLDLSIPTLLDEMTNAVDEAYAALPDRLYVVDADGRIAYRSGPGPMGFHSDDFEQAIRAQLGLEAIDVESQAAPPRAQRRPRRLRSPAASRAPMARGTWSSRRRWASATACWSCARGEGRLEGSWSTAMGGGDLSGTVGADRLEWTVTLEGPMGQMQLAFTAAVDGDALSGRGAVRNDGQRRLHRHARVTPGPATARTPVPAALRCHDVPRAARSRSAS